MTDATTLLFDLDDFHVVDVAVDPDVAGGRLVVVAATVEPACPDCGVLAARVHSRRRQRLADLPIGSGPLAVHWDKKRLFCDEPACGRRTFSEVTDQVGPRRRLTRRLREKLEDAVSRSVRSAADVAREYRVSWWSVNAALVARAVALTPAPREGVRRLGVDETRTRSVRYYLAMGAWKRTDPWMTSFVDLDPGHPRALLGLAPGRSGAAVTGWLAAQTAEFRAGIEVVAVDPSAPFAAALRRSLPHAELVVDVFHLHQLANLAVADTRRRVTQQRFGHRGRTGVDAWSYRRLLLRDGRALSTKQWRRLRWLFDTADPTGELLAVWAGKELLRQLLDDVEHGVRPYEVRARLARFYQCAADAHVPELTRLAETVETWWPAVQAYLRLRVTNAGTEGYNRLIKQIKRVACGFRSQEAYERRILLHSAAQTAA